MCKKLISKYPPSLMFVSRLTPACRQAGPRSRIFASAGFVSVIRNFVSETEPKKTPPVSWRGVFVSF
ncbi:hypothetical protein COY90_00940 [Candidatus Roizmanbacteria bacterium CG_4_10_14_0_8_um_filter_39_9]|uniref:Uncharacterized protein n=1 Tax=Candidatus Roizmanbacteria bacterium CG_4_10_14_0_8_um_filter_39_9 TaxID=1974829 RepID=A0A2M7QF52_9BACT|nr:MAG: hypothetical protein COY90_00940 [Candidatus Roizmanbacteria bacterium CG_4_10_14_0_8_um_filter_39_9]